MKISKKGLDLIKSFEKLELEAYICPAGKCTIGYGHTGLLHGEPVEIGDKITEQEAENLLKKDVSSAENTVNEEVDVILDLTQDQFDALVSFVFNVGYMNFVKSTLLRELNSENYKSAREEFLKWDKATNKDGMKLKLAGLTKRRLAEYQLFGTV